MLTEKQLKYQNKVKLIAFIIMVSGLLLVLLWSIKRKDEGNTQPVKSTVAINYTSSDGAAKSYNYTCASTSCSLSSQAGDFALINDGSYILLNLTTGQTDKLELPSMTKNFMVASDEFYGLVYTKDESNSAAFYESSQTRSIYDGELPYNEMNTKEISEALSQLYPRGYFYKVEEGVGSLYKLEGNEQVITGIEGFVTKDGVLYIITNKGVSYFDEAGTIVNKLTDAKKVYAAMHEDKFIIVDKDGQLKLATLEGERVETISEITGNIQTLTVENGILTVVVEDADYATNQKTIKYEYSIDAKQLKIVE